MYVCWVTFCYGNCVLMCEWIVAVLWAGHAMPIRGLCFSPDSTLLATASDDTHIKIYDVYVRLHQLFTHLSEINFLSTFKRVVFTHVSNWMLYYFFLMQNISRVTTCLEKLELSLNLTAVREMSGILLKIREMSEKILSGKSCLKLFIACKLHICVHAGI